MRRILVGLVVLLAVAVTPQARELVTRDGRPVKTVAVISGLGGAVVLYHAEPSVPITVYETSQRMMAIPYLLIDALIVRLIETAVAPRLNVVPPPANATGVDFGVWDARAIGAKILSLGTRDEIDAYIIACRDKRAIESGWFQTFSGLGLYHRDALFFEITDVFAAYRIAVVNARTGEIIADREAGIETGIFESALPRKRVAKSRWPGKDTPLPADQIPLLRDDLHALIDESVPWTLRELELTP